MAHWSSSPRSMNASIFYLSATRGPATGPGVVSSPFRSSTFCREPSTSTSGYSSRAVTPTTACLNPSSTSFTLRLPMAMHLASGRLMAVFYLIIKMSYVWLHCRMLSSHCVSCRKIQGKVLIEWVSSASKL